MITIFWHFTAFLFSVFFSTGLAASTREQGADDPHLFLEFINCASYVAQYIEVLESDLATTGKGGAREGNTSTRNEMVNLANLFYQRAIGSRDPVDFSKNGKDIEESAKSIFGSAIGKLRQFETNDKIIEGVNRCISRLEEVLRTERRLLRELKGIHAGPPSSDLLYQGLIAAVFIDVDCPYSRKMVEQVEKYSDLGIELSFVFYPRAGTDSFAFTQARNIWCSANQGLALSRVMSGHSIDSAVCEDPIREHYLLARRALVAGTPTIVYRDGSFVGGMLTPVQLAEELERRSGRGQRAKVKRQLDSDNQVRFQKRSEGIYDANALIIWSSSDNGADIGWGAANEYCRSKGSGWSLPTASQLQGLYDARVTDGPVFRKPAFLSGGSIPSMAQIATPLIRVSYDVFWSSERKGTDQAVAVYMDSGDKSNLLVSSSLRALCVKSK